MNVVVGVLLGWLGFNALVLVVAVVAGRNREVRPDVHDILDSHLD
jgi:hypothetical protein